MSVKTQDNYTKYRWIFLGIGIILAISIFLLDSTGWQAVPWYFTISRFLLMIYFALLLIFNLQRIRQRKKDNS